MRIVARSAVAITLASAGLLAATTLPAHAATSESDAYWNDQPVAKAWFNSGTSNPSKGPNSFTIKVEDGASYAVLWYQVNGSSAQTVEVDGSGNERSFSIAPSPTTHRTIDYGICGEYWGHKVCDDNGKFDLVQ